MILMETTKHDTNLLLQRLDGLSSDLLTDAQSFDPRLLQLFQYTYASNMRVRFVSGPKLTRPHSGPAAFGVIARARVATRARRKDGGLARCESGWGHEEDQLEARCGRTHSSHWGGHGSISHLGER